MSNVCKCFVFIVGEGVYGDRTEAFFLLSYARAVEGGTYSWLCSPSTRTKKVRAKNEYKRG